jgi:hypothetical protein
VHYAYQTDPLSLAKQMLHSHVSGFDAIRLAERW